MAFKPLWSPDALDELAEVEKPARAKIYERVGGYLARDPLMIGTPLRGALAGLHRYRMGDYRVIYAVDLENRTFKILNVAHRKDVYD